MKRIALGGGKFTPYRPWSKERGERVMALKERRRIVKALPRNVLENLCDTESRPWHKDRANLEDYVLSNWTPAMKDEIIKHLELVL